MAIVNPANLDIESLARRLPAFPAVIVQVLDLLRDDSVTLEALTRIIRNDPVVMASILAQANHIRRLRVQSDVTDPFVAASIIGVNHVRRIVVTIGMNSFMALLPGGSGLFQHSLAVAITAQEVATLSGLSPDHAYITGVLHDVGQLCLSMLDQLAFEKAHSESVIGAELLHREAELFGVDHCQIGARLAQYWKLPEAIHGAILSHHDDHIVTGPMQACISVANVLARALDLPMLPQNRVAEVNSLAVEALQLDWNAPEFANMLDRCVVRFHHALRK